MTDHNTTRSNRRGKRKAAQGIEAPEFEVLEVEATPIVEPAPEPTPIPEPEPAPAPVVEPTPEPTPVPQPKLAKPWELVRPMRQEDPNAWHRGQKWRP